MRRPRVALMFALSIAAAVSATGADLPAWRLVEPGAVPADARLQPLRTTYDKFHPWSPPSTKEAWEQQARELREQLAVACGLWPMPEKSELKPVVHGRVSRDGYTVDRVYFESMPGLFVTGNLYRPERVSGPVPGILCPHGHFANGRFHNAGDDEAKKEIERGAESTSAGAHHPLQACMVHLARMGCVVFHYDMIGYADNKPLDHRSGFSDVRAELWQQNLMGLQTWNSIRALDFLLAQPDVDPDRIGVTGSSGGGTQTFMLCALDPRPAAAFPAVMVSTDMQGGCVCENASHLRIGTNNVAIAALFAPKPLAMSAADDWTINIETRGMPELRQVYGFYGAADNVAARVWKEFGHNYNQPAREMMYGWFHKHLKIDRPEPIRETDFTPLSIDEMRVFTADHPLPATAADAGTLRETLTRRAREQLAAVMPSHPQKLESYRAVVGPAARVLLGAALPASNDLETSDVASVDGDGYRLFKLFLGRKSGGEKIPVVVLVPSESVTRAVVWVDDRGIGSFFDAQDKPAAAVRTLLDKNIAVVIPDLFQTGQYLAEGKPARPSVQAFAGFTYGYNRSWLAHRVRDINTVVAGVARQDRISRIDLIGTGGAGVWALLSRVGSGNTVQSTVVDLQGFRFDKIEDPSDPNLLPGALRYGGIGGLAALAAPAELTVAGARDAMPELTPLIEAQRVAGGKLMLRDGALTLEEAAAALLGL